MTIKIKMEVTEDEAEALLHYHGDRLRNVYLDQLPTAARIHDIAKPRAIVTGKQIGRAHV